MVNPHEEKCAHEELYGNMIDYVKYLRNFGEMGVVHIIVAIKEKKEDWVNMYISLCYVHTYTGGT